MTETSGVRSSKRRRVSETTTPKADDSTTLKRPNTRRKRGSSPLHKTGDANIGESGIRRNGTETKEEQSPKAKRTKRTKDVQEEVNGVSDEVARPKAKRGTRTRTKPLLAGDPAQKIEKGQPETPPRRSNRAKRTDARASTVAEKVIPRKDALKRSRPDKKGQSTKPSQNGEHAGADDTVWEVPIQEQDQLKGPSGGHTKDTAASQLQLELSGQINTVEKIDSVPYIKNFASVCEENRLERAIQPLCNIILERLNGKRPVPLQGLDTEYDTVHQLIEQTVVAGEGNSLLLLGARGCGKTAIVDSAISSISKSHKDDFYTVRLNGFLHTDDKIALREIWRQLGRENCPEDEELNKASSYADTLASLLALLSHPEEFTGPSQDVNSITTTKSVLIVIDEFDLFSYHPRQTLLYNLFDIAQARKAPVAVLGLTTKVDVTENLEKRVKSRFSHRYVFLPRPRTFADFSNICMASLEVSSTELSDDHGQDIREDIRNLSNVDEEQLLCSSWKIYLDVWQTDTINPFLYST